MTITDNAALILDHNYVTSYSYYSAILHVDSVTWNVYNNANVTFQDNQAHDGGAIAYLDSAVNITTFNNAAMIVSHNYATNSSSIILCKNDNNSTWNVYNNASITFQDNEAQDGGYIAHLEAVNINIFDNAAIICSELLFIYFIHV